MRSVLWRKEEALAAVKEAIDLHREFARVRPEESNHRLATSLYSRARNSRAGGGRVCPIRDLNRETDFARKCLILLVPSGRFCKI